MSLLHDRRHMVRRTRLVVAALAVAVLPGCGVPGFLKVSQPADGTTVKKLSTNLAFGEEAKAPRQAPPPMAAAPVFADVFDSIFPPAIQFFEPFKGEGFAELFDCPTAGDNVFPEEPATFLVDGTVTPGTYKWKQKGTFAIPPLLTVALPPLTRRVFRTLPSVNPTVRSFEVEIAAPGFTEIDTFEIRQTDPSIVTDGIFLTRVRFEAKDVNIDFNPLPILAPRIAQLPITDEPAVAAQAVDPVSGLSLTIAGSMNGHERFRLDACGEIVEAWKFSGTRVLQGLPPNESQSIRNTRFDLYFAPQLGGMVVGDHIVTILNMGGLQASVDNETNIGRLKPVGPA